MRTAGICWRALIFALIPLGKAAEEQPAAKEMEQVKLSEIGKSVVIVGRLGVPLGKMTAITAEYDPAKHPKDGRDFRGLRSLIKVTRVNGKELPEPVEIEPHQPKGAPSFPTDKPFECIGHEIGGYENFSRSFVREDTAAAIFPHTDTGTAHFQTSGSFGFYTSFSVEKMLSEPASKAALEAKDHLEDSDPAFPDAGPKREVKSQDIGSKVAIVGKLGIPMGQMTTVTATCVLPDGITTEKKISLKRVTIRVTKTDGKDLPEPVEISASTLDVDTHHLVPVGEAFECRGCEILPGLVQTSLFPHGAVVGGMVEAYYDRPSFFLVVTATHLEAEKERLGQ